ncbi:MAG TPA: helix-turn-helix domain-containing protein [Thermomicrobiales bacterium]|nr:helix-turn-helix domain-containing protein [Thermomicrobiales bacterium]
MLDVLYIDDIEQAGALLKPVRVELLKRMAEPTTCSQLASELGEVSQKLYYHVKVLERAGLVEKVSERRVGGIMEGLYQAVARSYWLSPELVGRIGGQQPARDLLSLGYVLSLAEELQRDIGLLAAGSDEQIPSAGLMARIELRDDAERAAFLRDLQQTVQSLAERYGARDGAQPGPGSSHAFRLMLACYPDPNPAAPAPRPADA